MANKGYDDTKQLLEMAKGIRSGRYGSVEQAAKAVLEDPRQSNVDRLRRKFREQDWRNRFTVVTDPGLVDCIRIIRRRLKSPRATVSRFFSRDVRADYPFITAMSALSAIPVFLLATDILKALLIDHALLPRLLIVAVGVTPLAAIVQMLCMVSLDRFEGYPSIDVPEAPLPE